MDFDNDWGRYNRSRKQIVQSLRVYGLSYDDAHDIFSEVITNVISKKSFDANRGEIGGLLHRSCHNRAKNHLRDRQRRKYECGTYETISPSLIRYLDYLIGHLDEKDTEVISLLLAGYTPSQIAEMSSVKSNSIHKRIRHAIEKMRSIHEKRKLANGTVPIRSTSPVCLGTRRSLAGHGGC